VSIISCYVIEIKDIFLFPNSRRTGLFPSAISRMESTSHIEICLMMIPSYYSVMNSLLTVLLPLEMEPSREEVSDETVGVFGSSHFCLKQLSSLIMC
jgi:hypothetical protein